MSWRDLFKKREEIRESKPEESASLRKEAIRKGRNQKADKLYETWKKTARAYLKKELIKNPSLLNGLSYDSLRGGTHGGSFYDFVSQENIVKQRPDGNYEIEIYPGQKSIGLERVDKGGEKGYSLQEIAGRISHFLVDTERSYGEYLRRGKFRKIPKRIEAIKMIKSLTGQDLREEVKKINLENKVVASVAIAGVLGGIFFLSTNITGNAIANLNVQSSSFLGAGLLVVGLVAGFFWVKKK